MGIFHERVNILGHVTYNMSLISIWQLDKFRSLSFSMIKINATLANIYDVFIAFLYRFSVPCLGLLNNPKFQHCLAHFFQTAKFVWD